MSKFVELIQWSPSQNACPFQIFALLACDMMLQKQQSCVPVDAPGDLIETARRNEACRVSQADGLDIISYARVPWLQLKQTVVPRASSSEDLFDDAKSSLTQPP